MVVGLATVARAPRVGAHIYSVPDPATGVTYYTNAPTAAAAAIVVRELPRPMPVSALSPSRLPPPTSDGPEPFDALIRQAATAYDVEYALVKAIIKAESGFNHRAVSPKGARGLMQLMPETAALLGVRDSFNPRENIHAGTRHLRGMMDRFHYDLPMAIAAYNAGDRPVASFRGIPPYPETREYVARVLRYYGAPLAWELQGSNIQQYIGRDGSVTYTNVAPRRFTTAALQTK